MASGFCNVYDVLEARDNKKALACANSPNPRVHALRALYFLLCVIDAGEDVFAVYVALWRNFCTQMCQDWWDVVEQFVVATCEIDGGEPAVTFLTALKRHGVLPTCLSSFAMDIVGRRCSTCPAAARCLLAVADVTRSNADTWFRANLFPGTATAVMTHDLLIEHGVLPVHYCPPGVGWRFVATVVAAASPACVLRACRFLAPHAPAITTLAPWIVSALGRIGVTLELPSDDAALDARINKKM